MCLSISAYLFQNPLGSLAPELLPKSCWRFSNESAEDGGKVALTRETELVSDLRD